MTSFLEATIMQFAISSPGSTDADPGSKRKAISAQPEGSGPSAGIFVRTIIMFLIVGELACYICVFS